MRNQNEVMRRCRLVPEVVGVSPFVFYKAGIQSRTSGDGIVVRGIDLNLEKSAGTLQDNIVAGAYSFTSPRPDEDERHAGGILLGQDLAKRLEVEVGDPVVLYSISDKNLGPSAIPKKGYFRLSGIFKSGFNEYDAQLAYISIKDAQALFQLDSAVTGVHVQVKDLFEAKSVVAKIKKLLGQGYDIAPWGELYSNLFTWVQMERLIIYLIFGLIILVAAFSIISTLVMIVLEKRTEIAILKTLGVTSGSLRKIFIYNGLTIGVIGVSAGWILAGILIVIQNHFHVLSLPADVYFISYLPFAASFGDFAQIGLATLLVCFLAGVYPAQRAASQSVVETLRQ